MKLTVLGSGTFFVSQSETASSFLLETSGKKILVDCGPGTLYRLSQLGLKPEDIDYLFLTHFHPDHSSDLFPFFMNIRLNDLLTPGSVSRFPQFFGPPGLDQFLLDYSNLTELKSYEGWGKIKVNHYQASHQLDNFLVKPYQVLHKPFNFQARAYALRFESEGKIVTFSGDSALCQGIKDAAQNADIFVCDASFPKGTLGSSSGVVHMDTLEIGAIARDAKVKKVYLTHFYPQYKNIDLISQVKEIYSGQIENCHDQMEIEF